MAKARLTISAVKAARPAEKDFFLWDDEIAGFGLKVTPKGRKVFVFQYRPGGRGSPTRRMNIGLVGTWTAETARKEARRLRAKVDQGGDPAKERQRRKQQATDFDGDALLDRFKEEVIDVDWSRSRDDVSRLIDLHLKGRLGSLVDLEKRDVVAVLDAVPRKHRALKAKVYAVLNRFLGWAVAKDYIAQSPLAGVPAPSSPPPRQRVLNDEELKTVWSATFEQGYPFGPLYRLLILTGQRRNEGALLDWKELDRSERLWSIPGERAKNGQPNFVPLSEAAIELLDEIAGAEKWPRRGLVFSTTGKTAVSGFSAGKRRLDALVSKSGETLDAWRVHDLRRTVATNLQKIGVRFEVTEAILNHRSGSKSGVAGIYQTHDWAPEKRAALEGWAAQLSQITKQSGSELNVASLRKRRKA